MNPALHFLIYEFCQKVDPLQICIAKSDNPPKKKQQQKKKKKGGACQVCPPKSTPAISMFAWCNVLGMITR